MTKTTIDERYYQDLVRQLADINRDIKDGIDNLDILSNYQDVKSEIEYLDSLRSE